MPPNEPKPRPTPDAPESKKRATPVPSPETEALRAVRKLRQLKERYETTVKDHAEDVKKLQKEADDVRAALSTEAKAIVGKLEGTNGGEQ